MEIRLFRRLISDAPVILFLAFLLLSVLTFVALHFLHMYASLVEGYGGIFEYRKLSISADRGLAEIFNYFQCIFLVVLLFLVYRKSQQIVYLILSGVYFVVFLDDALSIHEMLGRLLSGRDYQPNELGVRPQDYGELAAFALAGAPLLVALLFGLKKASPLHLRLAMLFGVCLGALLFFAVFVDFYHRMFDEDPVMRLILGAVEDGGEMLAIALACALALLIYRCDELSVPNPNAVEPGNRRR